MSDIFNSIIALFKTKVLFLQIQNGIHFDGSEELLGHSLDILTNIKRKE
jgi:hypothetical protein